MIELVRNELWTAKRFKKCSTWTFEPIGPQHAVRCRHGDRMCPLDKTQISKLLKKKHNSKMSETLEINISQENSHVSNYCSLCSTFDLFLNSDILHANLLYFLKIQRSRKFLRLLEKNISTDSYYEPFQKLSYFD